MMIRKIIKQSLVAEVF